MLGLLGKTYATEFRMFRVFHWVDGGSEKLSHLLKVAELIGGRTGSVTRRLLAQGVGEVGTPLHMRTRTHIHQRPEGELTAQPILPTLSPGTVLGLWTGGKKGRCTHSLSA